MGETCGFNDGGCVGNSACVGITTDYGSGTCTCPDGTTADADKAWCTGTAILGGDCISAGNDYACSGIVKSFIFIINLYIHLHVHGFIIMKSSLSIHV